MASLPGFDPSAWLSFVTVGGGLLIHITLVNLVLGMSVIVPMTEYLAYRRKDPELRLLAKKLFRFLIIADLIAGTFGTWVAISLTAFFPKLLYIFSTVLLIPVLLAIIGIVMAVPSIAFYWYAWERVSARTHMIAGAIMAIGALIVPAGFRVLFAFVDDPTGFNISSLSGPTGNVSTNFASLFGNPIYVTLLFHSWFGGLTMSALFAAGVYGWHYNTQAKKVKTAAPAQGEMTSNLERDGGREVEGTGAKLNSREAHYIEMIRNYNYTKYLLKIGLIFLTIQSAIGIIYYFVLAKYSPYIFAAITGNMSVAGYNFELVFVPFISLVVVIWITTLILQFQVRSRRGVKGTPKVSRLAAFFLAFSTFTALPLGEASNDASRAPYMLITGTSGVSANNFSNTEIPLTWTYSYYLATLAFVAIAVFLATVYFVFVKRHKESPRP